MSPERGLGGRREGMLHDESNTTKGNGAGWGGPPTDEPGTGVGFDPTVPSSAGSTSGPPTLSLDDIRLPAGFDSGGGGERLITTVAVRKPNKHEWFRIHPTYGLPIAAFRHRSGSDEIYVVHGSLCEALANDLTPMVLRLAISRQGALFLWPLRLPSSDGRPDNWARSALEAATLAVRQWIRMAANMAAGAYDVFRAKGDFGDPTWPDMSFDDIVRIAFRERFIDSLDHPILRELRGES